jgi:hypothetical protein
MTTTQDRSHDDLRVQQHHHSHSHAFESPPGPSEAGSVVLDIGPGAGAAVILTPADMDGLEIEYRASGDAWEEKHMAVRERRGPGAVRHAAIFGPLPPGLYEFRQRGNEDQTATLAVTVRGGLVATEAWPTTG